MSALAWGRLLRLSLAPSAAADVAAGLLIGGYGVFPLHAASALAIGASLCVYHGGMVLNDWADRGADGVSRPERPIPSGAVAPQAALGVALTLIAAALALSAAISPHAAAWMGGLALLVVAYDLFGRGPWIGPLLLGACRAANLGFGLYYSGTLAPAPLGALPDLAPALLVAYGAYVFCASRVARLEDVASDAEVGAAPRTYLTLAALVLLAPAFLARPDGALGVPDPVALGLCAAGSLGLVLTVVRTRTWRRADAGRATGMALRRLLIFTAAASLAARSGSIDAWVVAAAILGGYSISAALRVVFPPT